MDSRWIFPFEEVWFQRGMWGTLKEEKDAQEQQQSRASYCLFRGESELTAHSQHVSWITNENQKRPELAGNHSIHELKVSFLCLFQTLYGDEGGKTVLRAAAAPPRSSRSPCSLETSAHAAPDPSLCVWSYWNKNHIVSFIWQLELKSRCVCGWKNTF